jgi:hypothetical protein
VHVYTSTHDKSIGYDLEFLTGFQRPNLGPLKFNFGFDWQQQIHAGKMEVGGVGPVGVGKPIEYAITQILPMAVRPLYWRQIPSMCILWIKQPV